MPKGVSISARISQEDADFIGQLSVDGAETPSDKLRALIADAKRRSLGKNDYLSTLKQLEELTSPNLNHIRGAEHRDGVHSELIAELYDCLPELLAYLVSGTHADMTLEQLVELESGAADRLFRLIEAVLYMKVRRATVGYQRDNTDRLVDEVSALAQKLGD